MKKLSYLFVLLFMTNATIRPQSANSKPPTVIDNVLKEIKGFQTGESKRDSAAGHPLGSFKEEDFLRRYTFYNSVDKELLAVDRTNLSFDDEINLDLLEYDIEDEVSSYKFRSYLNPILSDEGFHTGLPGRASAVMTSKKEYEDYIRWMKDIPRYVREHLDLMRKGLQLGICQPASILDGYQNTYEQHIVTEVQKSVFYKPFLQRPGLIADNDWKNLMQDGEKAIREDVIPSFIEIRLSSTKSTCRRRENDRRF
jgi:uncharacterized protein (DUF885 family)